MVCDFNGDVSLAWYGGFIMIYRTRESDIVVKSTVVE